MLPLVLRRPLSMTLLLLAAPLGAQGLPTAQSLAARHDSLVGGRATLEAHQSVRMIGSFSLAAAGIDAPLEILKVRPNKYLFRTSMGQLGELLSGYDGRTAWVIQPGQGPVILDGEQAAQVAEQGDFFGDLHDTTKFESMETLEETEFEGRRAYKVRLARRNGTVVHEYFDVATGLSAGGSMSVPTPLGPMEMVTVLSDYREFGGMRVATRVVQKNPQFEVVLSIVSVEFDTIDPSAVALPESVKALVKP
ncbi:MAG: hypothetical protein KJZ74_00840 [Gemmatimonadales bacterium]|nr:hypothetical protein [Gemmatimonadales bacterium]